MANDPRNADAHIMSYRPDIDGLRAVAVLSVVLYHLNGRLLPGGFLGVDVFFVISGYLITTIIWREIEAGNFRISKFYERRVRRIMPARLVLLLATTVASALILLPVALIGYAKSLLATLAFAANIYFWRDSDYFSHVASEKPLLHMWSLGVEEQFYIFFPLALLAFARYARRWVVPGVVALIVASYVLNVLLLRVGGATPAFYLLPTRAWELGGGAVVALMARAEPRRLFAYLGGLVGALLLGTDLTLGPRLTPSVIPVATSGVVGAMLLIRCGVVRSSWMNRLLGSAPLVGVGLISYSLYLWHWPILALLRYWLVSDLSLSLSLLALAAMFVAAILSWRYVERPFRRRSVGAKRVVVYAMAGSLLTCIASASLLANQGLPGRLDARATRLNASVGAIFRCPVRDYITAGLARGCLMQLPSRRPQDAQVLMIGNSHALMYTPLLRGILSDHKMSGALLNANRCLPSIKFNLSRDCFGQANDYIEAAEKLKAPIVFIGLEWSPGVRGLVDSAGTPYLGSVSDGLIAAVSDTIDRLEQAGKTVVLIGPIDQPGWDVASIASRSLAFGRPLPHPVEESRARFDQKMAATLDTFGRRHDIVFVRPDLAQCRAGRCDFIRDGQSLFSDDNHLADQALPLFRKSFEDSLDAALERVHHRDGG